MMSSLPKTKDLRGTWFQALIGIFGPILFFLVLRWAFFEPFVIPSGSMIPNLLIHDHILVKKFSFGLKLPFSDFWLFRWGEPERGQIVVFRYPKNPQVYFVKRLIGMPGDKIEIEGGQVSVNGSRWGQVPIETLEEDYEYFWEESSNSRHIIRFRESPPRGEGEEYLVPEGQYFFMGDNRDESHDSRSWGFVSEEALIGPVVLVWLSCESMLKAAPFVCDPSKLRWSRMFTRISVLQDRAL